MNVMHAHVRCGQRIVYATMVTCLLVGAGTTIKRLYAAEVLAADYSETTSPAKGSPEKSSPVSMADTASALAVKAAAEQANTALPEDVKFMTQDMLKAFESWDDDAFVAKVKEAAHAVGDGKISRDDFKAFLTARNRLGWSPMLEACLLGDTERVKFLVDVLKEVYPPKEPKNLAYLAAIMNQQAINDHATPLMMSVWAPRLDVTEVYLDALKTIFLNNGGKQYVKDMLKVETKDGWQAFQLALYGDDDHVVTMMRNFYQEVYGKDTAEYKNIMSGQALAGGTSDAVNAILPYILTPHIREELGLPPYEGMLKRTLVDDLYDPTREDTEANLTLKDYLERALKAFPIKMELVKEKYPDKTQEELDEISTQNNLKLFFYVAGQDKDGWTALHHAIAEGDSASPQIEIMIDFAMKNFKAEHPSAVELFLNRTQNDAGSTAFHLAADRKHYAIMKMMLNKINTYFKPFDPQGGIRVMNVCDDRHGRTPLIGVAYDTLESGDVPFGIMQLLISVGQNLVAANTEDMYYFLNTFDYDRKTALSYARLAPDTAQKALLTVELAKGKPVAQAYVTVAARED